jgi:hypothetical protein
MESKGNRKNEYQFIVTLDSVQTRRKFTTTIDLTAFDIYEDPARIRVELIDGVHGLISAMLSAMPWMGDRGVKEVSG